MNVVIRPGRRVSLPSGHYRYQQPVDGALMLVSEDDGRTLFLPWEEFKKLYADHQVRIHGVKVANAHDDAGGLAPGESLDPCEEARAWFCREWDKANCSRSVRALEKFVADRKTLAVNAGLTHFPSGGALIKALRERGELDHRPDSVMQSRTGKAPRVSSFDTVAEKLIFRSVAWYWSARPRTKSGAYARLVGLIAIFNRFARRHYGASWENIKVPCFETMRTRINKAETYDAWVSKFSRREAKLRFKGTAPTLDAKHVLDQVVIDATTVDGWCVWREANMLPLGRPTLYIATDVRSRMAIAYLLSWEPPSLYGVMETIKRIVTPNANDTWGKPNELVVDCAWEHRSPSLIAACASAGISLHWPPGRTPEYKAIGERVFKTVNMMVFHRLLGGAVPFPPTEMSRLGLNPAKTASIGLEELEEHLAYALNVRYANKVHTGIGEAPRLVWNRDIASPQHGRRVVDDVGALVLHFGQTETCTLTREGVRTRDGMRFYDERAVTHLLSELSQDVPHRERRRKGSAKIPVKVVVNPVDVKSAMVWNPKTRRPMTFGNVHIKFAAECSSRWEYNQIKKFAKEQDAAFSTDDERLAQLRLLQARIEASTPDLRAKATRRRRKLMEKMAKNPSGDTIAWGRAETSVDGYGLSDGDILTGVPAKTNRGDGLPIKGVRRGGVQAEEKRQQTMAAKRETKAAEAAEALASEAPVSAEVKPPTVQKRSVAREADITSEIDAVSKLSWVMAADAGNRKDSK